MPHLTDEPTGVAPTARRSDWRETGAESDAPDLELVPASMRPQVALRWTHVAQRAHASIAAHARLSLQLLTLGAPPDLVERASAAMADATATARAAFALASAYAGRPIGPGRLPRDRSEGDDLAGILAFVLAEGCVGGTLGAIEANEAEGSCTDRAVRAALARIAVAQGEQAELGWRTVRWALEQDEAGARELLAEEIARLEADAEGTPPPTTTAADASFLAWGVATEALRASIRSSTIERVVLPRLRASLAAGTRRAA